MFSDRASQMPQSSPLEALLQKAGKNTTDGITTSLASVARLFPVVPQTTILVVRQLSKSLKGITLEQTPLEYYGNIQLSLWCDVFLEEVQSNNLTFFDTDDMFENLLQLQAILTKNELPTAVKFARMFLIFTACVSNICAHISKLSHIEPIDYQGCVALATSAVEEKGKTESSSTALALPKVADFKSKVVLGAGGFGSVFKCVHTPTETTCAVKLVKYEGGSILSQAIDRIVASVVNHPHLVKYYAVLYVTKVSLTAMEYLRGVDAQRLIDQVGFLSFRESRLLYIQAVLAIIHMHVHGFVHGDIKASNCIILYGGRLKIFDFDTCRICFSHLSSRYTRLFFSQTAKEQKFTRPFGTVGYMAPELIQGQMYGRAIDWWSMGIMLFKFVFGKTPFRGRTDESVERSVLHSPLEFREFKGYQVTQKEIAGGFLTLILDKDPAKRLGSKTYADIMNHKYLSGFDFTRLTRKPGEDDFHLYDTFLGLTETQSKEPLKPSVARDYSPAPGKICRKLEVKLEDCKDQSTQSPIFTYISPTFMKSPSNNLASLDGSDTQVVTPIHQLRLEHLSSLSTNLQSSDKSKLEVLDLVLIPPTFWQSIVSITSKGIGLILETQYGQDGRMWSVVSGVNAGSSAEDSGMLEGDVIVSVSGVSVVNSTVDVTKNLLQRSGNAPLTRISVLSSSVFRVLHSRIDMAVHLPKVGSLTVQPKDNKTSGWFSTTKTSIKVVSLFNGDPNRPSFNKVPVVMLVEGDKTAPTLFTGDIIKTINDKNVWDTPLGTCQSLFRKMGKESNLEVLPVSPLRTNRWIFDRMLRTYNSEGVLQDDGSVLRETLEGILTYDICEVDDIFPVGIMSPVVGRGQQISEQIANIQRRLSTTANGKRSYNPSRCTRDMEKSSGKGTGTKAQNGAPKGTDAPN